MLRNLFNHHLQYRPIRYWIHSFGKFFSSILSFFPISNLNRKYGKNGNDIRRMRPILKIKVKIIKIMAEKYIGFLCIHINHF